MAFPVSDPGCVDRPTYWKYFIGFIIALPVLLVIGFICLLSGNWVVGILAILMIIPAGIYFRVIMMRRCRDIGWPAWLPWAFLGANMAVSMMGVFSAPFVQSSAATPDISMFLGTMNIVGWADFIFSIVIGCMATKDYTHISDVFDDTPYRPADASPAGSPASIFGQNAAAAPAMRQQAAMPLNFASPSDRMAGEDGTAKHDAAIAQALAQYKAKQAGERVGEPATGTPSRPANRTEPARPAPASHVFAPARATGFGRKKV